MIEIPESEWTEKIRLWRDLSDEDRETLLIPLAERERIATTVCLRVVAGLASGTFDVLTWPLLTSEDGIVLKMAEMHDAWTAWPTIGLAAPGSFDRDSAGSHPIGWQPPVTDRLGAVRVTFRPGTQMVTAVYEGGLPPAGFLTVARRAPVVSEKRGGHTPWTHRQLMGLDPAPQDGGGRG